MASSISKIISHEQFDLMKKRLILQYETCQVILYTQHIFRVCLVHMHLGENMQKAITPSDFKHYINSIVSTHW